MVTFNNVYKPQQMHVESAGAGAGQFGREGKGPYHENPREAEVWRLGGGVVFCTCLLNRRPGRREQQS